MRLVKLAVAAVLTIAVLATAGTFVYIHFIEGDPPAKLTLEASPSSTTAPAAGDAVALDGSWKASATGSEVGYRVDEVLFGQKNTAVGRTSQVTGSLTVAGTTVSAATVTADLTTVKSDRAQRDNQFQGRIMDTAKFPTATFELTAPIEVGSPPAAGHVVAAEAKGNLTLHGTTKAVTTKVSAKFDGRTIAVNGSIPVVFADYGIPNPTFGPVSTDDHGTLEFLVLFTRA